MPSRTQQQSGGLSLRLLGLREKVTRTGEATEAESSRPGGVRGLPAARAGPPGAKDLNSGGPEGAAGPRVTILSEEGWGRRGVCRSASPSRSSSPPTPPPRGKGKREKKKVEGRRGEEPPRFLPRSLRKGWGGAGRERARTERTNGRQQVQASAGPRAGPPVAAARGPSLPSPSPPPTSSGPAAPSTPRPGPHPDRCLHRRRGPGWRAGAGRGLPRRRILPRGGAGGGAGGGAASPVLSPPPPTPSAEEWGGLGLSDTSAARAWHPG